MSAEDLPRAVRDPGRAILFTERAWRHISAARPGLLEELEAILAAVEHPDFREPDPLPARERFSRRHPIDRVRWMRVVVGFSGDPAVIVTAFVQRKNPAA